MKRKIKDIYDPAEQMEIYPRTHASAVVMGKDKVLSTAYEEISEKFQKNVFGTPYVFSGFIDSDGYKYDDGLGYRCSDFIPVRKVETIEVVGASLEYIALVAYYDKNKRFISSIADPLYHNVKVVIEKSSIPKGTEYIRVTSLMNVGESYVRLGTITDIYGKISERLGSDDIPDGLITTSKMADSSVTSAKINDKSVTFSKLNKSVFKDVTEDWQYAVAELYIDGKYIKPGKVLTLKFYRGIGYIRCNFASDLTQYDWQSLFSLSDVTDNGVFPIKVTPPVRDTEIPAGTTVGYIIISDTARLSAVNDDGFGNRLYDSYIMNLTNSPVIASYLNFHTVNTEDIEDNAVTSEKLSTDIMEKLNAAGVLSADIVLPSEIYVPQGDNLQIFWNSIVGAKNPYVYDIAAECSVGKSYPRYFSYMAEREGTYPVKVKVRGNDLKVIAEKDSTIKVVPQLSSPSTNKNILCVGASSTSGGQWVNELKRRLVQTDGEEGNFFNPKGLGLTNITFAGRKHGYLNPVNLEATGGWRVYDYAHKGSEAYRFEVNGVSQLYPQDKYSINGVTFTITEINVTEGTGNIRCYFDKAGNIPATGVLQRVSGEGDAKITYTSATRENANPFWNNATGKLDFANYARLYCGGAMDIVIFHCGTNDIFTEGESGIIKATDSFRIILRQYHSDFPSGKVIISSVPTGSTNGGFAANYGSKYLYYDIKKLVQKYANALMSVCKEPEFMPYVLYAPVMEEFDSENGFPTMDAAVNNRASETEKLGTNAVHPTPQAYYMISDVMYRTLSALKL